MPKVACPGRPLLLGACTLEGRNRLAVSLCEQSDSCTVTDERAATRGPDHVRAMDEILGRHAQLPLAQGGRSAPG